MVSSETLGSLTAVNTADSVEVTVGTTHRARPLGTADRVGRTARRVKAGESPGGTSGLLTPILARERIQRRSLAVADGLAALTALFLAALLTHATLTWPVALVLLAVVIIAKLQGLYDRDQLVLRKSTLQETPRLLELAAVSGVIVYFARDELLSGHHGTSAFFCLVAVFMAILLPVGRVCARRIGCSVVPPEQCLGVGDLTVLGDLRQRMVHVRGTNLVGAVRTEELPRSAGELHALAARVNAHRIIIAPEPRAPDDQTDDLIRCSRAAGLRVSVLPGLMAVFGGGRTVDQFGGYTLVGLPHFGLSRSSAAIKRAFDLLFAAVATVVLAPVMMATAIWVKLDTPGPVLFRQTRVGRDGQRFQILKFRSMIDGADAMKVDLLSLNEAGDGLFKIAADPRVTRSGRWLRRTRADELPQLFNILRGEMSLVGPRPLVAEEDNRIVGRDRDRLHLMPGITGPWQSLGSHSHTLPIGEMAKLDYMYVANWSLWEDTFILLRTIGVVAGRRGV